MYSYIYIIIYIFPSTGVHRSLGTHVSKVRSVELDRQIWKANLIKVCVSLIAVYCMVYLRLQCIYACNHVCT